MPDDRKKKDKTFQQSLFKSLLRKRIEKVEIKKRKPGEKSLADQIGFGGKKKKEGFGE